MSETEPVDRAHAPLPLADLLAMLRGRGLALGVREHLMVGRLLSRFDDPDLDTLRDSLAALLARNPGEVELVRETFDQLYGASPEPAPPAPPSPRGRLLRAWSRLRHVARLRWVAWLAAAFLILTLTAFAGSWVWHRLHPPPPQPVGGGPPPPVEQPPVDRPPPPVITETYPVRNRGRTLAASAGVATLAFLWLYLARTRRLARRRARAFWSRELDARPGPQTYDLVIQDLPPPFSAEVLDDMATLLGRQSTGTPQGRELDVDRTLERTLRAGLAPQVVLRARAASLPLLVLEDVADGMRPWRRRIEALLTGLEARGVPLERWRFHADAGRLFRSVGGPSLSLRQLFRLRAESPLLVISAGRGIREGEDGTVALWVRMLRGWRYRAWLHPATDPATWSAALRQVPLEVWPMTPDGLLAAARRVARGDVRPPDRRKARTSSERPPAPLDVDRMRWLLTLAPRRDPDLAELLRQRFCPHVPEAALIEALAAPPLDAYPGVGPKGVEIPPFFLDVLAASRPAAGSVAYERWQLDRALQLVRLAGEAGAAELAGLAGGPLGGEVERALRSLPRETFRRVRSRVLRPLRRREVRTGFLAEPESGRHRWTWPTLGELAAAVIAAALMWGAAPWLGRVLNDRAPVSQKILFTLSSAPKSETEAFLKVEHQDVRPHDFSVYQNGSFLARSRTLAISIAGLTLRGISQLPVPRGYWYDVRYPIDSTTLAVSRPLWIGILPPVRPGIAPTPAAPALASKENGPASIIVDRTDLLPLEPKKVTLKTGTIHRYRVDLKKGQYLHIIVDQYGIDVGVRVLAPDGIPALTVDSPTGAKGQEELAYVAPISGQFTIVIEPIGSKERKGYYSIWLDTIRPATAKDYDRAALLASQRVDTRLAQRLQQTIQTGTLTVRFNPPASNPRTFEVSSGKTTLTGREGQPMKLAAGTWRISSPYFASDGLFDVSAGEDSTVDIPVGFGFLAINYPEGVNPRDIRVDGEIWNGAPVRRLPGPVTIELKNSQYDEQQTVKIEAGQTTTAQFAPRQPSKASGSAQQTVPSIELTVVGSPGQEFDIWLYGNRLDETPEYWAPTVYSGEIGPQGSVTISVPRLNLVLGKPNGRTGMSLDLSNEQGPSKTVKLPPPMVK